MSATEIETIGATKHLMRPMPDNISSVVSDPATDSNAIGMRTLEITADGTENAQPVNEQGERVYPSGLKLFSIVLSLIGVLLLSGLDGNIVATAVPSITDHFHTVADVGWYFTSYRLCSSSFQFAFGKLYTMFSTKRLFMTCTVIFLFGSVLCAAATSSHMFIAGRAVTGLAVAGGTAGCFSIVMEHLPLQRRPVYTGVLGAVEGIASIVAPVLGGVITQKLSWRWCFWINVPICALSIIGLGFFLPDDRKRNVERSSWRETAKGLDLIGTIVFVPALAALFIALSWAGTTYSWHDPRIIALFVLFAVLLGVFIVDQAVKGDSATLPFRVLKKRNVIGGFIFSFSMASSLGIMEYYIPIYFQVVYGYSPARSGYMMLPTLIGTLLAVLIQGSGTSFLGYYAPFMIASSILLPIGAGLTTTWTPQTPLAELILYPALVGFGAGIGFMGPQTSVQTACSPADAPLGLATVLFAQNFGPALSVAIAQALFTARLSSRLHVLAPKLATAGIESLGLTEIRTTFGGDNLDGVLLAFSEALAQTWYLAVGLACLSMVGSLMTDWRSVKEKES